MMISILDANDPATILCDADVFFKKWFPDSDDDEVIRVNKVVKVPVNTDLTGRDFELYQRLIAALVQVYDLVLPFDGARAACFLQRLGVIGATLLNDRDDYRHQTPPFPPGAYFDTFRGRVMPAWGFFTDNRDGKWNTDPYSAGFLAYAMAAFARRVADHPARYPQHQGDAIRFITAVIETYMAFRPELNLFQSDPNDPEAYFIHPLGYETLNCPAGKTQHSCQVYRDGAKNRLPIGFNESLSMMQTLAECALAADSALYRGSACATPNTLILATEEMPLVVAKNVTFFLDHLGSNTLSDGTPYFDKWPGGSNESDLSHVGLSLVCLAVIHELQMGLNSLLARAGRVERIPFSTSDGIKIANTFLRKIWQNDVLPQFVDGSTKDNGDYNDGCAGWIPYAQFDQRVWRHSRDTTFHFPFDEKGNPMPDLKEANHGALLRYREFNSNSTKYLTDFAGQNWLITPAPLAAGENHPKSIHDQKWLLVLSGVVIADLRGEDGEWGHQTVSFIPDMAGTDDPDSISGPLNWAINRYSIPKPAGFPGMDYLIRFSVEEWPPFVSPSAMFNESQAMNCGFAVDLWRPSHFGSGTDVLTNQPVNNIFSGVNADLAVREKDAWLYRLGYRITLLGKIVFVAPPPSPC